MRRSSVTPATSTRAPRTCRTSTSAWSRSRARSRRSRRCCCWTSRPPGCRADDKTQLARLLRRIADAGIAVVLVEHDMAVVMGISDHVVVLDAGVRIASGTPAEVQRDPAVRKAYLGEVQAAHGGAAPGAPARRCSRSAGSTPAMAPSRC